MAGVSLFDVVVVGVGLSISEGLSIGVLQVTSSAEVVRLALVQSIQVLLSTTLQLDRKISRIISLPQTVRWKQNKLTDVSLNFRETFNWPTLKEKRLNVKYVSASYREFRHPDWFRLLVADLFFQSLIPNIRAGL